MSRRWLKEPLMTQDEAKQWVDWQLSLSPKRSEGEILTDMKKYIPMYQGSIESENAKVIVDYLTSKTREMISKAEVDKQKRDAVGRVLEQKGVPATPGTGPMSKILEYADIRKPAKGTGGRKTRKTRSRKNGRRSLKRKTKH